MKKKKKIDKEQTLYWAIFILFAVLTVVIAQVWVEDQLRTVFNYGRSSIVSRLLPKTELNQIKDWQVYVDPYSRFKFYFPSDWILDSEKPDHLVLTDAKNKITVDYFAKVENFKTESFNYQKSEDTLIGRDNLPAIASDFISKDKKSSFKVVYFKKLESPEIVTLNSANEDFPEAEKTLATFLKNISFLEID